MQKLSNVFVVLLVTLMFLGFSSCSTKKNTLVTRSYHNLTSHYNIFFNGEQALKKGIRKIEDSYQEEYTKLLPVFKFSEVEDVGMVKGDMERVIDKSTKLIDKHSITVKPKKKGGIFERKKSFYKKNEYNKWVDDSYLLIGKAQFYTREYQKALETFTFIINRFSDEDIIELAWLWLLRTQVEENNFGEANKLITKMNKDRLVNKKNQGYYQAIITHYFIKRDNYDEAIDHVKRAIEHTRDKHKAQRYTYILAQLHVEKKQYVKATDYFSEVIKMNPPYEMNFNAQVKMAALMDVDKTNSDRVKRELLKMLDDDKNIEYRDKIYYALAQIAFKEGKIEQAIRYYKNAANAGIDNTNQKVMAYLALADIYFSRSNYPMAKAYYDSTNAFITEDFPDYREIVVNTNNLNDLVTNLNEVHLQDSLQKIARMSEAEREALMSRLIEEYQEKERLRKEREAMDRQARLYNGQDQSYQQQLGATGKWYFYNPASLSYGQSEFEKKWGRRKLEDNWRRKNKETVSVSETSEEDIEESEETGETKEEFKKTDKRYYLQNVPLTEEQMEQSHEKVANSLFNAGKIYHERLGNNAKAIGMFEELLDRYPHDEKALPAMYKLYLINKEEGLTDEAEFYKQKIIRDYPHTNYTRVLVNPNFIEEVQQEEMQLNNLYRETFEAYQSGMYNKVFSNYKLAKAKYADTELFPRFTFLNILANGQEAGNRVLKQELNEFVKSIADEELIGHAEKILARIETIQFEQATTGTDEMAMETGEKDKGKQKEEAAEQLYTFNDSTAHYFVAVVKNSVDLNQFKFNITTFIIDFYDLDDFEITDEPLNETFRNVVVKSFEASGAAMEFLQKIEKEKNVFDEFDASNYQYFVISGDNYKKFLKDRSLADYFTFFRQHY